MRDLAPGTAVRVVVNGEDVYGEVVRARVGDRIAVAIWGAGRSAVVDDAQPVKLSRSRMLEIAEEQSGSAFIARLAKAGERPRYAKGAER